MVLIARGIRKDFKRREVLKDINLYINRGEIVGLLGPNGAGKTTLFNCLVGFLPVDGGKIELDGEDITLLPAHKRAQKGGLFLLAISWQGGFTPKGFICSFIRVRN